MVVYQISGEYETRSEQLIKYHQVGKNLLERFEQIYIEQIPQAENTQAEALARLATSEEMINMDNIVITKLITPSESRLTINVDETVWTRQIRPSGGQSLIFQIEAPGENWISPIIKYIETRFLPEDKFLAHQL